MNKEEFLKQLEIFQGVYGYMYGSPWMTYSSGYCDKDKIIFMKIKSDDVGKSGESFYYVWGWPGPDFNEYRFSDYKKTWAFRETDIEPPEIPEDCCSCEKCEYAPEEAGQFKVCLPAKCPRTKQLLERGGSVKDIQGYCKVGKMSENAKRGIVFPIHKWNSEDVYEVRLVKTKNNLREQHDHR